MSPDLDHETSQAITALVHRLRNRDPEVDDEVFAREFMTALRGRGWRPTPLVDRPAPVTPASEEARREITAALRAERGWDRDPRTRGKVA